MRRLVLAGLCVALVACSDDDGSGPRPVQIPGTYKLQTINGQALPFFLININNAFIIAQVGGRVVLNSNFTYREENDLRQVFNDENGVPIVTDTTVTLTGTYESQDSAVLLTSTQGFVSFGYVSANRLTLSLEAGDSLFTFVYQRN